MREAKIEDEIHVNASIDDVWRAIKDPVRHARWHPFVTQISGEHRLGAARTCSVIVGKKTGHTKERCVEEEEARVITWAIGEDSTGFSRMVSDWRAGFRLEQHDDGALVKAHSAFKPKNVLVRLMSPIIRRKFHQTQHTILKGLKRSIEAQR